jgi:hypothetical protein
MRLSRSAGVSFSASARRSAGKVRDGRACAKLQRPSAALAFLVSDGFAWLAASPPAANDNSSRNVARRLCLKHANPPVGSAVRDEPGPDLPRRAVWSSPGSCPRALPLLARGPSLHWLTSRVLVAVGSPISVPAPSWLGVGLDFTWMTDHVHDGVPFTFRCICAREHAAMVGHRSQSVCPKRTLHVQHRTRLQARCTGNKAGA